MSDYLKERGFPILQDSSNLSDEYTRNRIRHHILPAMEQEDQWKSGGTYGRNRTDSGRGRFVSSEKGSRTSGTMQERKPDIFWMMQFFEQDPISGICGYGGI